MKATGIVRRIDDLGRIVIPKEIRRTLRLREGSPLEIFTDREGGIILKKYSPIAELSNFSGQYADALAQNAGHMVAITDRDQLIPAAGGIKKEMMGKGISKPFEQIINEREIHLAAKGDRGFIMITDEDDGNYFGQVVAPIICEGDVIGSVVLLSKDERAKMGELEKKLAGTAAGFLGKQMEG